jgi:hypothetical protein
MCNALYQYFQDDTTRTDCENAQFATVSQIISVKDDVGVFDKLKLDGT